MLDNAEQSQSQDDQVNNVDSPPYLEVQPTCLHGIVPFSHVVVKPCTEEPGIAAIISHHASKGDLANSSM